jgi:hypothetical protein
MYLSFHWYFVLFVSSLIPRSMQFTYIIVCHSVSIFYHNSTSEYILSNSNLRDSHFMLHYFYVQMFWFDLVTFIHTLLMNSIHSNPLTHAELLLQIISDPHLEKSSAATQNVFCITITEYKSLLLQYHNTTNCKLTNLKNTAHSYHWTCSTCSQPRSLSSPLHTITPEVHLFKGQIHIVLEEFAVP